MIHNKFSDVSPVSSVGVLVDTLPLPVSVPVTAGLADVSPVSVSGVPVKVLSIPEFTVQADVSSVLVSGFPADI